MLVFGGFANSECFNDVHVLHLATESWRILQTAGDAPEPVTSHSAVSDGDYVLVFGGTSADFGVKNSEKLHMLDVAAARWSEVTAPGDKPSARYGQSMVRRPDTSEVYIFGGTTGQEFFDDLHCFDAQSVTWRKVESKGSSAPASRYRHAALSTHSTMYIIGGGNNQPLDVSKPVAVWSFNYETCTWTEHQTQAAGKYAAPVPRLCHTAVLRDNCIYVHGGTNGREIYGQHMWRLCLSTWKWTQLPSPTTSTQLFFHSACLTTRGRYVTFGGCLDRSGPHGVAQTRSDKLDMRWIGVPALVDACLQSLARARAFSANVRETLPETGPLRFLEPMIVDAIVPGALESADVAPMVC
jgi:hypothetical protein